LETNYERCSVWQTCAGEKKDEPEAVGNVELAENRRQVVAHRDLANEQTLTDLLASQTLASKCSHLPLTIGEQLKRRSVGLRLLRLLIVSRNTRDQTRSQRPIKPDFPGMNLADGFK
jgi:hypothetical protein